MEYTREQLKKGFIKFLKKNKADRYYFAYFAVSPQFRIDDGSHPGEKEFFLDEDPHRWISAAFIWSATRMQNVDDPGMLWGNLSMQWEEMMDDIMYATDWKHVPYWVRNLFFCELDKNSVVI
jgi:hypothetical protein